MRTTALAGVLLTGLLGVEAGEEKRDPPRQRVLVELFTSQG